MIKVGEAWKGFVKDAGMVAEKGTKRQRGNRLKFTFLNISVSHYSYFPRPQGRLARFSWVTFLFRDAKIVLN